MSTASASGASRVSAIPATRTARHARIADLLGRTAVRSQTELADLLAADGVNDNARTTTSASSRTSTVASPPRNTSSRIAWPAPTHHVACRHW